MFIRLRGFSLLEVMLALVVVAIGISVLLSFSTSSHRETADKGIGNDYSVIVNHVLEEFTTANLDCSTNGTAGSCDLLKNTTSQEAGNYLARSKTLSPNQKDAINATGIQVTITSCRSDEEHTTGSCS